MNRMKLPFAIAAAGLLATSADAKGPLPVADIKRAKPVDFQSEILPFLRSNCLACHNRTKAKADLILETPQDIMEADAVVPGKPDESILFLLSAHMDDPPMPPPENKASAKNLSPQQLGLLKLWIAQGAKGKVTAARTVEWAPLPEGLNAIYSVAVTPDGQYAAAGRANQIFIYHVPSKKLVTRLTDPALLKDNLYKNGVSHRDMVHALTFNQTGDLLASGGYREVKLWRRQPMKAQRTLALNSDAAIIALAGNGQALAVAEGNNIRLINPNTGAAIKTLSGHKMPVTSVAFSPDNKQLLSGAADGVFHIWNLADGKFTAPKVAMEKPSKITAVTWITSGKLIVTAHEDNLMRAWDVAAAQGEAPEGGLKPHKELKGHSQPILALTRVPNNDTQVLSGSRDGTVRQWDANGGNQVRSMTHGGPVIAVSVSPDATKFASASENNTGKIWNAANGQQIAELRGQRDAKLDLAKRERELAFAKKEVTYHTNNLKAKADELKKADDRLKKADEAKKKAEAAPIAEKKKTLDAANAEKKTNEDKFNKLKADYDAEVKVFTDADAAAKTAETAATKAKADAAKPVASLAAKEKVAATSKTAADNAKKNLDNLTNTQLKPAEAKAATAKTAAAAAQKAFETADSEAKAAEENSKKIAGDANKKPEEKQAAAKAATDKRNAANAAKTKLTQAQAAEKAAVAAVTAAKGRVDAAKKASDTAAKASADAAKAAADAKPLADKAKAAQAAAEKVATDKRKAANDSKTKRDKLNTEQAAAKKAFDDSTKKATTAQGEYDKLETPRKNAVNEFELATKAKAKADTIHKEADAGKKAADEHSKQVEAAVLAKKEATTKAEMPIRAIAFSADSQQVLTGGDDMKVHTWSAATGEALESFNGHKGAVKALVFNGEKFISASADKTAQVWSLGVEWKLERVVGTGDAKSALTDRVNTIDFSPDGKQIATGSGEPSRGGEVQIWNIADGKLAKNFAETHSDSVLGLEFSRDGKYIASASADKFVKVTEIATGKIVHNFEGHTHHALGVSWLPHGRQLVSVGADNSIRHWNFEAGERIRQRTNLGKEVTSIHYVGLTEQAVVTAGDKSVRLINTSNLNDARSFAGGTDYMYACAATPDAKYIVAGGEDSALRVWTLADGKAVATFEAPKPSAETEEEK